MQHPRLTQLALGLASLVLLPACDDDKGGESEAIANRLRECDLVSDGKLNPFVADLQFARCLAQCEVDATCEELEAIHCDSAPPSDRVSDCRAACATPECDNGERSYTLLDRCDGEKVCEDGRDEADCPQPDDSEPEYCADSGDRITVLTRCNGVNNCEDGSDERDCPDMFNCGSALGVAQLVPKSALCDLKRDCLNGADESEEQGCAQLCPN